MKCKEHQKLFCTTAQFFHLLGLANGSESEYAVELYVFITIQEP